ncbi:MAG: hypothetical protein RLZZ08_1188 [Pseudomonadota bacterium]
MTGTLFLAHRLPFPPDRGDKIRSFNLLKALARLGPVHVASFAENPADLANAMELQGLATSLCLPLRDKSMVQSGMEALLRREPVSLAAFHHHRIGEWVADTLRQQQIDAIYVFSGQMGQYVPARWQGPLVVDLVDVDSAKFEAYAGTHSWPMSWIDAREARLLRAEEARLAARADHTLLVSEAEAELLRSRLPHGTRAQVSALGNGIDADLFDPAKVQPHRQLGQGPHIVFTGQMDYPPNVAAALRGIGQILPALRRVHPHAQFHVVGRAPVAELLAHDGQHGCRIWGEVEDVRPFLAAADAVLVPLELARGVQNKVLEAMAMARPVVLTTPAATGIGAVDGEHLAVHDADDALAAAVLALLADPEQAQSMGARARQFVVDHRSWPAMLTDLPRLLTRG